MWHRVKSHAISAGHAGLVVGTAIGLNTLAIGVQAQDAREPAATVQEAEDLLERVPSAGTPGATTPDDSQLPTPSFEELDSAATDLNDALAGARAKLDELRQATELAAMAAELRDELEGSIQENNRLAASLAEVQGERSELEMLHNEALRQISELTQTSEASKLEIADLSERLANRQEQIDSLNQARRTADSQIRDMEVELADTGDEVDRLRGEIADLTGQLEATRTELDEANTDVASARDARDAADRELTKVKKQIAGMLRSVLLGGEPIDVSALEAEDAAATAEAAEATGAEYQTVRASNIRSEPDPDSERVGFANRGETVTVLGKVNGRNWFQVRTEDGTTGYIFGELIQPSA
jgi:DNA repair exonuclease SbcCD ATPase subunit